MIRGGFKNMNSDQIIKCILSVLLKMEKSLVDKLDRGGYQGTAQILDDRITVLENPDVVLKYSDDSTETLTGLNLSLLEDAYEWRINGIVTDNAAAYNTTLVEASDGFYKFALLQGNVNGTYSIKYSEETAEIGSIPVADDGNIALRAYLIFGDTVDSSTIIDTSIIYLPNPGDVDYLPINTTASVFNIGFANSITGFTIDPSKIYPGKDFYFRSTDHDTILKNEASSVNNVVFYDILGDRLLPSGTNLHFKYFPDNSQGYLGYLTYVGYDISGKIDSLEKGADNGVATLDSNGKIPASQLPVLPYIPDPEQLDFKMNGVDNFINIGTTKVVVSVYLETQLQEKIWWSQTGSLLTFSFIDIQPLNTLIQIIVK